MRASAGGNTVDFAYRLALAAILAIVALTLPATAEETPKRGGTLTYMIPADAPPSFDGHRESTYATVHAVAPFYSVLIRVNPDNPSSTTDLVCDLCTADADSRPTTGRTYTFKIREGVKWHDGSPLTAADVAASFNEIIFPPDRGPERARQQLRRWSTRSRRPIRRPSSSISSSRPARF